MNNLLLLSATIFIVTSSILAGPVWSEPSEHEEYLKLFDDDAEPRKVDEISEMLDRLEDETISIDRNKHVPVRDLLKLKVNVDGFGCDRVDLFTYNEILEKVKNKPALKAYVHVYRPLKVMRCLQTIKSTFDQSLKAKNHDAMTNHEIEQIRVKFYSLIGETSDTLMLANRKSPIYSLLTREKLQEALAKYIEDKYNIPEGKLDVEFYRNTIIYTSLRTEDCNRKMGEILHQLGFLEKIHKETLIEAPIQVQEMLLDIKISSNIDTGAQFGKEVLKLIEIERDTPYNLPTLYSRQPVSALLSDFEQLMETFNEPKPWETVWLLVRSISSSVDLNHNNEDRTRNLLNHANLLYSLSKNEDRNFTSDEANNYMKDLRSFKNNPGVKIYIEHFKKEYVSEALETISHYVKGSPIITKDWMVDLVDIAIMSMYRKEIATVEDGNNLNVPLHSSLNREVIIKSILSYIDTNKLKDVDSFLKDIGSQCKDELSHINKNIAILPQLERIDMDTILNSDKQIKMDLVSANIVSIMGVDQEFNLIKEAVLAGKPKLLNLGRYLPRLSN